MSEVKQRYPYQQNKGPEYTLRIGNLDESTTRDDVFNMFQRFGHITRVFVSLNDKTGKCRGTALVSFRYEEDADAAQQAMDRSKYGYLILSVHRTHKSQTSDGRA